MHSLQNLEGRFILLSVPVADALLTSSTVCCRIPVLFIYNTFIFPFTMDCSVTFEEST